MMFLEVDDIEKCYADLVTRDLVSQYKYVKLSVIKIFDW